MSWLQAGFVFVILWWLCLFMVLPFGVRRDEEPVRGQDPGAPANPHLLRKALATTLLAALFTGILAYLLNTGLISIRP